MVENTHPSDSYTLCTRCQPEVLDGAASAINIGIADGGTPQDVPAAPLAAAGHTDIDRRLFYSFKLETSIKRRTGTFIMHGCLGIRLSKELLHSALRRLLAHHDKIPRLHESHRAGLMCCGQDSRKNTVRNRGQQEISPDIPPFEYRTVDRCTLMIRKLIVTGNAIIGLQSHTMLLRQRLPMRCLR